MAHFRFVITGNAFGDVSQLYQAIRPFLDGVFWNDVRNADTCAWLVAGCLRSQQCSLPDWVSGRPSKAQYALSRERQGRRFLGNPNLDPISVYGPLVTAALRDWGEHCLVLALDTSMLFNQFCLIRVAVVFRGRAVPLYQEVIEHGSTQVSTEHLLPLLARVKGMLDFLGIKAVRLLADRGFCDVALMTWLRVCNWQFRIRIKSNLILADPMGQRLCQLNEIKLAPREMRCFHRVTITGSILALFTLRSVAQHRKRSSGKSSGVNRPPSTHSPNMANASESKRIFWTIKAGCSTSKRPDCETPSA